MMTTPPGSGAASNQHPLSRDAARLGAALSDRYRIERELGAGGMATVYLAEDIKHHRRVAIKVLHAELSAVLGSVRFLKEIELTANLQHAHILPLFDSGSANGLLYYVMPFVEGETLRSRLERETQLRVDDALLIAREVADALSYAHGKGVVHRDIKPENVLLQNGHALVADFGIALAVEQAGGQRVTQTGLSLGTPQYMSPEQAMGERTVDARTDIYALGAMTYEMLAGEPPFIGPNAQAILARVITERPRPLGELRETVPHATEDAVHAALAKLPADRFASATEFAQALAGNGSGTSAPLRRSKRIPARSGWAATLRQPIVLGLALVTLASVAFAVREWAAGTNATPERVVRFFVGLPDGYRPQLFDANGPALDISADGSMVVFPVIDRGGTQHLYLRPLADAAGRVLAGTEGAQDPLFTADGASVLFHSAGRILKIDLAGDVAQLVAETGNFSAYTRTPSGDIVYSPPGGARNLVQLPNSNNASPRMIPLDSTAGEQSQFYPRALADGRHVLYVSRGPGGLEQSRIGLLDLSTHRTQRLDVQGTYPLGMLEGRLIYLDQTGRVLAVSLDLASGEVSGEPIPLADGVLTVAEGSAVAALSATGTLVYALGEQRSRLVLANAARTTMLPAEPRAYAFPRYSPDGSLIAVTITSGGSSDIWLMRAATGALTRLTSGRSVNERPEWSPDGRRVLFRSSSGGASSGIWWQPRDGSSPATPLLSDEKRSYFEGVITPDARSLVYQEDNGDANVLMRDIEGDGDPRPIATTSGVEDQARVSPDGRWVAYVTTESGAPQVVVQPLTDHGARAQVSVGAGREPVWSRDGRRIFFRNDGKFMVADVSSSPTFRITKRAEFMNDTFLISNFPHAGYDVSPDGSTLLVTEGEAPKLLVVHNWRVEVSAALRNAEER